MPTREGDFALYRREAECQDRSALAVSILLASEGARDSGWADLTVNGCAFHGPHTSSGRLRRLPGMRALLLGSFPRGLPLKKPLNVERGLLSGSAFSEPFLQGCYLFTNLVEQPPTAAARPQIFDDRRAFALECLESCM